MNLKYKSDPFFLKYNRNESTKNVSKQFTNNHQMERNKLRAELLRDLSAEAQQNFNTLFQLESF